MLWSELVFCALWCVPYLPSVDLNSGSCYAIRTYAWFLWADFLLWGFMLGWFLYLLGLKKNNWCLCDFFHIDLKNALHHLRTKIQYYWINKLFFVAHDYSTYTPSIMNLAMKSNFKFFINESANDFLFYAWTYSLRERYPNLAMHIRLFIWKFGAMFLCQTVLFSISVHELTCTYNEMMTVILYCIGTLAYNCVCSALLSDFQKKVRLWLLQPIKTFDMHSCTRHS